MRPWKGWKVGPKKRLFLADSAGSSSFPKIASPGAQKRNCASGAIQLSRAGFLVPANRLNCCRSSSDQRCHLGSSLLKRTAAQGFPELDKIMRVDDFQTTQLLTRQIKSSLVGLVGIAMVSLLSTRSTRNSISRCKKSVGFQHLKFHSCFSFAATTVVISSFHQGHHDVMKLGIAKYNEECRGIAWPSGLRVHLCSDS